MQHVTRQWVSKCKRNMDKKTTKKSQVIISMGHISKASTAILPISQKLQLHQNHTK